MPLEQNEVVQYRNKFIESAVSGFCGAYLAFFFEATKKRLQSNQQIPTLSNMSMLRWVRETFRGSLSFSLCATPTMVVQQLTDAYCKNHFSSTSYANYASALFSGALGGVVSTGVENMLLTQQIKKINARAAFSTLINESYFRLFRGLWLFARHEINRQLCKRTVG
jgi:hypothetical protein